MSDVAVLSSTGVRFETTVLLLIIGAGACGLTAALAVYDVGRAAITRGA